MLARVRLVPDHRVDRVELLRSDVLHAWGIEALLLDVDETLIPAACDLPAPEVSAWCASLREDGIPLAIVSNGHIDRVRRCAEHLGVPAIPVAGKPWPRAMRRSVDRLGVPATRVAMVGDQLFTDTLGARWAGVRSILVRPLSQAGLPHTIALRKVEQFLLRRGAHGRPVHR